ncbi:MAG: NAD+ synthase [Bacteroidales bacterium]
MKVALAQCNYHIGHFEQNEQVLRDAIRRARGAGADLVIFSELAVCGYPPYDFLEFGDFVDQSIATIGRLAKECDGIAAIIGGPERNPRTEGKELFNAAYFLENKAIRTTARKSLLPTYDIFDEYRYFEPATAFSIIEYKGERIALTICEDLWDVGEELMYTRWPMDELAKQQPTLMINIAASPFHHEQPELRQEILAINARKYGLPLVYVNQVGAQTELLFDGGSMVISRQGERVLNLRSFSEDFGIIETGQTDQMPWARGFEPSRMAMCHDALIMGIRDYFRKLGFSRAILGLSGGLDSAVVLVLAAEALGPENVRALLLPSRYSSDHSVADALALAENLGVPHETISIEEGFIAMENSLKSSFGNRKPDITEENIQARLRAVILMAHANKFGYILLNTSNKSEAAVGYGTLYGDMCGGLSVIGDLYKSEVYELAAYLNRHHEVIPQNIIIKPPSAELRPDQKDEDSLPPYAILDQILYQYIEERKSPAAIIADGFDAETVLRTMKLVNSSEHKRRQSPPTLRVSSKAFGYGRRMPIVAKYLL